MEGDVVDADILIQHKENIQPMAAGRRVTTLANTLATTPKGKLDPRKQIKQRLRDEAEAALENEDDPLAAWVSFVTWTVDNYPGGASHESGLLELLEHVTRIFAQDDMYKMDMRYLKLWLQYASLMDQPLKIFSYLYVNEIGTGFALFYEEYCNTLEKIGQRAEASEMYEVGIARKARPIARLEARKRDFAKRMLLAGHDVQPNATQQRPAFEVKQQKGRLKTRVDQPYTLPATDTAVAAPSGNKGGFKVYSEGKEEKPDANPWDELETRDAQRKENVKGAVPAQGEILKQKITAPQTPKVDVYVDSDSEAPKTPARKTAVDDVFTRSARKAGIDTLKRDPLRNHQLAPPISAFPTLEQPKFDIGPKPPNESDTKEESSKKPVPKALPPVKANERLALDQAVIWHRELGELLPAEARAMFLGLYHKKWPLPPAESLIPLDQQDANSRQAKLARDGGKSREDGTERVKFEGTRTIGGRTRTITGDATVTINTKEALVDVYGMYNSPTKSLNLKREDLSIFQSENPANGLPKPNTLLKQGLEKKLASFAPLIEEDEDGKTPGPKIRLALSKTPGENIQTPAASKTPGTTVRKALSLRSIVTTADPPPQDELPPETPLPYRSNASMLAFAEKTEDEEIEPASDVQPRAHSRLLRDDDFESQDKPLNDSYEDEDVFGRNGPMQALEPDVFSGEVHGSFRPSRGQGGYVFADQENDEDSFDNDDAHEIVVPSSVYESDGDSFDQEQEGFVGEGYGDGRWAPALTPITERTYEHTNTTSRHWSTPQEVRDRTVSDDMTGTFSENQALLAAEQLALELRMEDDDMRMTRNQGDSGLQVWQDDEEVDAQQDDGIIEPADPYTSAAKSRLMAQLPAPSTHRDLRPKAFGHLEKLQKFAKQHARRCSKDASMSSTSRKSSAMAAETFNLVLDEDVYEVSAKLGEGGFGAVFLATDLSRAKKDESDVSGDCSLASTGLVAIKVIKPATLWESYALQRMLDHLPSQLLPSIIQPYNLYIFKDETYHILEFSHHGTLLEAVNKAGDFNIGNGQGIPGLDEMLAMFFTVELLKVLEGLHREGFIHGDLKIDNCMVRINRPEINDHYLSAQYDPTGGGGWEFNGVKLIDFGRTIDTSLWPAGQTFIMGGDWKADKKDCLQIRNGQSWTYEPDYYGLAGIIFCLLFGKYMEMPIIKKDDSGEEVQRLPATLKRYWKTELWEPLFDMLLNPSGEGRQLPIVDELADIREKMEEWLVENANKSSRRTNLKTLIKRLSALSLW